ncbi:uncharacterized protein LOC108111681 [Drosophila eugracilis]|uniref:uncharacterized protein LOC108111681 n=1 Tax=Drosophila eugracilis TaxID=29029 RepID=UPI001BD9DB78|nr:uncharacterized protein LOC108111681 [Drosophila eugracilis]
MQPTIRLLFLVGLLTCVGGVLARDDSGTTYKGTPPNSPEYLDDNGILVLNPTNSLQNGNEEAINRFTDYIDSSAEKIISDLPNTRKKKRRQALMEALQVLTGVRLGVSPLGESLGSIKEQQAELISKLKHQEEWNFWAAAKVQRVGEFTKGHRTPEAVSITEEFNNRYGLQMRNCVSDFLWAQIRLNLDLSTSLDGLQDSTRLVIVATENCPDLKAKKCRKAIRKANEGLQNAPQDLHNLWIESKSLEDTQKQSNQCLEKTLKEYAEERMEVESQLEEVINEYLESEPAGK